MAGGPVVFVHGLWLHASSWGSWAEVFRESGYEPLVPGWPGIPEEVGEARTNPGSAAGKGIDEIVGHYAQVIAGLDARPVVVGHSFGGLIAQRALVDHEDLALKTSHVFLFGTPSAGLEKATGFSFFKRQVRDMAFTLRRVDE